jgi:predicted amidohydrolase
MVTNELHITLVQFNIAWESSKANLQRIEELLSQSEGNPDLILLPEMFNSGFSLKPKNVATTMDGEIIQWMLDLAQRKNAAVAGSLVIEEQSNYYNRFMIVYPNGKMQWYDKHHLFRMVGENKAYSAGNKKVIVKLHGWKLALFVCYDLRFPVWSRSLNDCDLALYVASWPAARNNVWEILLKARAIENQCYVAGVNRVGKDGLGDYLGNSMVVDFKGNPIGDVLTEEEGLVETTIAMQSLNQFRNSFPVWKDADKFSIHLED